jgi:methyl-accepting chemotaxis protein
MTQEKFMEIIENKTQSIIQKLTMIKEIAKNTVKELQEQQETLNNCSNRMNEIEHNLTLSGRLITNISSIAGTTFNYFRSAPVLEEKKQEIQTSSRQNSVRSGSSQIEAKSEKMKEISSLLDDIKDIGLQMGDELDKSNATLKTISKQVDQSAENMKKFNKKLDKIAS